MSGHSRSLAALALCTAALALAWGNVPAQAAGPPGALDARAWELVSPADKNGGEVGAFGSEAAGVLQASADGAAFAFGSTASFGPAAGAAPVNQYLSSRGGGGWSTWNLTPPLLSGTYAGGAYQLFSTDLSRAVLSNGWSCALGEALCRAANPSLGSGAPAGYRDLYLSEAGAYRPLISTANAPALGVPAEDFQLSLAGADPDLRHVVISTCAALTGEAVQTPSGGGGCEASAQNLYEWSDGTLRAINLLPGEAESTPGAAIAAPAGAISTDGSRVYFTGVPVPGERNVYLRHGNQTAQVDEAQGGGGTFQTASADGAVAFFTKAGHLYRFNAITETATDLTPGGEVQGVLGASANGAYLYCLTASGLYLLHGATTTKIAAGADPSNYPPAIGSARLSADGTRLAFLSSLSLTGYANAGKAEAYLYDATANGGAGKLLCASCNPKGAAPLGSATIPGAVSVTEGPAAYKPRALTADGTRLFFTSPDALVPGDSDNRPDVYEWQAAGAGGCVSAKGCPGLVSSGRLGSAAFADAGASGDDVFFTTATALLPADPGSEDLDLYDAHVNGGFPEPPAPLPCEGDACQGPAPAPDDPTPGTATFIGPANPPVMFAKEKKKKPHHKKHHRKSRHKRRGQK